MTSLDNLELLETFRIMLREELKPIQLNVTQLNEQINGLNQHVNQIAQDVRNQGHQIERIECKLDAIFEQVVHNTERLEVSCTHLHDLYRRMIDMEFAVTLSKPRSMGF